ncbi:MAG: hypothetical protein HFI75_01295 [Lachnospiraceae bacterium]|nr:hypothetical protein [Lachnospiraceae bacterium]
MMRLFDEEEILKSYIRCERCSSISAGLNIAFCQPLAIITLTQMDSLNGLNKSLKSE